MKLWDKVDKDGPIPTHRPELGPCWLWTGCISTGGYAKVGTTRKTLYAHRVSYEQTHGPIPTGLDIDHLCRVRRCIRPSHLEATTRKVNLRRGLNARSMRTHCIRGHALSGVNLKVLRDGRRNCWACIRDSRDRRAAEALGVLARA